MASPFSSIAAILVSTGLFLMGNGLIGTREVFTPVPQGSPASLPLDPRGPAQENFL